MKIVLTGMLDRQLSALADELRAEFPEVRVEVVGNDEGDRKLHSAMRTAALTVAGRFVNHDVQKHARRSKLPFTVAHSGVNGIRSVVRDFLLGGRV